MGFTVSDYSITYTQSSSDQYQNAHAYRDTGAFSYAQPNGHAHLYAYPGSIGNAYPGSQPHTGTPRIAAPGA